MSSFLAAAIQMNSRADKPANCEAAARLIELAARRGATLVVLPELFNCLAQPQQIVAQAESIPGPTSELMGRLAAEHKVTLVAGSIAERAADADHVYNTSLLFDADGKLRAQYRKIHLFEVDMPGKVCFSESDFVLPGTDTVVTETPVARWGQATCYDLRFPELFRQLTDEGAEVVVLPSAFTATTGADHWEVLLRARAIENQLFVVAPNQTGHHAASMNSYGRSMIVDPWGTVLATASDGTGMAMAEIDLAQIARVRQRLPALRNCRLRGGPGVAGS